MKDIRYITRADDLGSSHSANLAIEKVIDAGFVKNVSIMACGPCVEDAAQLFAHRKDVCFGMHITLNAEWDKVKWSPVLPLAEQSGMVAHNGFFHSHPSTFAQTKPDVGTIIKEIDAQLERLHKLGFPICYIDSHMFPEMYVEGLDAAVEAFAKRKGLIDHMYFYRLPHWGLNLCDAKGIEELPDGQYFGVSHPSLDTEEMRLTGNASVSGALVAASRARETALLSDKAYCRNLEATGIRGIRYDEARSKNRLTVAEMVRNLYGK